MGGAGGTPNVASKLVERRRPYKSISPLHFVFGRSEDITFKSFSRDVLQANLNPAPNACSGFDLPVVTDTEGLAPLTWGKNFTLREDGRSFR